MNVLVSQSNPNTNYYFFIIIFLAVRLSRERILLFKAVKLCVNILNKQ